MDGFVSRYNPVELILTGNTVARRFDSSRDAPDGTSQQLG